MSEVVKSVITPNDRTVRDVFSRSKAFSIDIYQREYKWSKTQVEALLNDIDIRFNMHTREKSKPKEITSNVLEKFDPYYLNTFLTSEGISSVSVVDGQQRLTTLLLILVKLREILCSIEAEPSVYENKPTFASTTLEHLIFERDDFGEATKYKIYNENREKAFDSLVKSTDFIPTDETQNNIVKNHKIISSYYENFFRDCNGLYDTIKLTYYISYILDRISIVEIKIEQQKSVAMIFEVVNDRGLGLRPHEILKGKFIGGLSQERKEETNNIWVKMQGQYFEKEINFDSFFQTYFRAKFMSGKKLDYDSFSDDQYHYEIQRNTKAVSTFGRFQDSTVLYDFVKKEFQYFGELFVELHTSYNYEYVFYNRINKQNQQLLLILSAVKFDDQNKKEKIELVSKKFDQMYVVSQLLGTYNSRDQSNIFDLCTKIREKSLQEISTAFDNAILAQLLKEEKIQTIPNGGLNEIFRYELFKGVRNGNHEFSKYLLSRIDRYIAKYLDLPSYMNTDFDEFEKRFRTKRKYGLHLEHILAHNTGNHSQFIDKDTGEFDEAQFDATRNLLGMVLLLKDRQNESSNNESYKKKIDRYKTSDFVWNRLLVGHLDVVDVRNIPNEWGIDTVNANPDETFPVDKMMPRQKVIFNLIKAIWMF